MKSCPTCDRTFENTFTFCLADGSLLNAPFDPQSTLATPEPRQTEPPTTEALFEGETRSGLPPPRVAATGPTRRQREAVPTVASSITEFETVESAPRIKDPLTRPSRKSRRLPLMIGALATLLVIGAAVFVLGDRTNTEPPNPANANGAAVSAAVPDSTEAANSEAAAGEETPSPEESTTVTESAGTEPAPSPRRLPTKKAARVPPTAGNASRKDNPVVAKPERPKVKAPSSPCANKSYPVCNQGERLRCDAASGSWQCRRSGK
jgi:hypothetical protein